MSSRETRVRKMVEAIALSLLEPGGRRAGYSVMRLRPPNWDVEYLIEDKPLEAIERILHSAIQKMPSLAAHPLAAEIEKSVMNCGGSKKDWLVMSAQKDPFGIDTPGNRTAAQWLKDAMDRLGITGKIHDRGLHYAVLSGDTIKPDGVRYANTEDDWQWLVGVVGVARWLNYVRFDQIVDQKNSEAVLRVRKTPNPMGSIGADLDVTVPDGDDCQPTVALDGFTGTQPYRIALVGEKSSLEPVLGPISQRYGTDLLLFTGNASNTRLYELAKAAAADGRPLVVLYFADCDPWGYRMSIEVSRKLQAFAAQQFPGLAYRVYSVALTPDQVREYELPESPIEKGRDTSRQAWIDAMGIEQVEIDALATLRPELLEQITLEWIAKFWDDTLDQRVAEAATPWVNTAQRVIDDAVDQDALDAAVAELDRLRDEAQTVIDERIQPIIDAAGEVALPELPDLPEAEIDEAAQPMGLIDSRWSFAEQTRRLIAAKNYAQ
jgi:hypothetical protein